MKVGEQRLLWWNLKGPGAGRMRRQLRAARDEFEALPTVLAFAEVLASSLQFLREELPDYTVIAPTSDLKPTQRRSVLAIRGDAEELSATERFTIPGSHQVPEARGFQIWPRSMVSAQATLGGQAVEIHAVHIPNGSSNGWVKIDHLWALRYGLGRSKLPQIVASDLNTPKAERDGEIITFGQNLDGSFPIGEQSTSPYTPDRPWSAKPWSEGERAVLDGLPRDLDMADAMRELHPADPGFTWGPGGESDRRLDHVFVSRCLCLRSARHINSWRECGLSDHSAVDVVFAP